jgi:hypothetical protein
LEILARGPQSYRVWSQASPFGWAYFRELGHYGSVLAADEAKVLAREFLLGMGTRWSHVAAVGQEAERLADESERVGEDLVCAAWLHDLGYAPEFFDTGMHALDGARALVRLDLPPSVVALVAHHTGAEFEAAERGLTKELSSLPVPDRDSLDILTLVDLSISPTGQPMSVSARIAEILDRYERGHPVARAVGRSKDYLLASCDRARVALDLSDDWPFVSGKGMGDAKAHRGVQL